MSNPYETQTISGYNDSPPPDDGSATAANQVTWQKHLDKIGDPIKTLAEAINTELLSAFGKIHGNTHSTKSVSYTVTTGDQGAVLAASTGGITFTLPAAATAGQGFPVTFVNISPGIVTIDADGSETIDVGDTPVLSIDIQPGQAAFLTTDGTSWVGYITGPPLQSKSATNTSWTSSTTLTDITGLTGFFLAANGEYEFEALLRVYQNGGDFKFTPTGSGITSAHYRWTAIDQSGVLAQGFEPINLTGTPAITTLTNADFFGLHMVGRVLAPGTDVTDFRLRGAQNSSNANATTVYGSSWMKVRRIT